jgi:hypothetical protein
MDNQKTKSYVIVDNKTKYYYVNDQLHRENGPAIVCGNGTKHYYRDNVLHREDGPASVFADGSKYWFLNGEHLTEKEFNKRVIKKEL